MDGLGVVYLKTNWITPKWEGRARNVSAVFGENFVNLSWLNVKLISPNLKVGIRLVRRFCQLGGKVSCLCLFYNLHLQGLLAGRQHDVCRKDAAAPVAVAKETQVAFNLATKPNFFPSRTISESKNLPHRHSRTHTHTHKHTRAEEQKRIHKSRQQKLHQRLEIVARRQGTEYGG